MTDRMIELLKKLSSSDIIALIALLVSILALMLTMVQWIVGQRKSRREELERDNEERLQIVKDDLGRVLRTNILLFGPPPVTLQDVMDGKQCMALVDQMTLDNIAQKLASYAAVLQVHYDNVGLRVSNIQRRVVRVQYARSILEALKSLANQDWLKLNLGLIEHTLDTLL